MNKTNHNDNTTKIIHSKSKTSKVGKQVAEWYHDHLWKRFIEDNTEKYPIASLIVINTAINIEAEKKHYQYEERFYAAIDAILQLDPPVQKVILVLTGELHFLNEANTQQGKVQDKRWIEIHQTELQRRISQCGRELALDIVSIGKFFESKDAKHFIKKVQLYYDSDSLFRSDVDKNITREVDRMLSKKWKKTNIQNAFSVLQRAESITAECIEDQKTALVEVKSIIKGFSKHRQALFSDSELLVELFKEADDFLRKTLDLQATKAPLKEDLAMQGKIQDLLEEGAAILGVLIDEVRKQPLEEEKRRFMTLAAAAPWIHSLAKASNDKNYYVFRAFAKHYQTQDANDEHVVDTNILCASVLQYVFSESVTFLPYHLIFPQAMEKTTPEVSLPIKSDPWKELHAGYSRFFGLLYMPEDCYDLALRKENVVKILNGLVRQIYDTIGTSEHDKIINSNKLLILSLYHLNQSIIEGNISDITHEKLSTVISKVVTVVRQEKGSANPPALSKAHDSSTLRASEGTQRLETVQESFEQFVQTLKYPTAPSIKQTCTNEWLKDIVRQIENIRASKKDKSITFNKLIITGLTNLNQFTAKSDMPACENAELSAIITETINQHKENENELSLPSTQSQRSSLLSLSSLKLFNNDAWKQPGDKPGFFATRINKDSRRPCAGSVPGARTRGARIPFSARSG
jgi:hypothetical protein